MRTLFYDVFETDLGWVGLLGSERGIRRSSLPCRSPKECLGDLGAEAEGAARDERRFEGLRQRLSGYLQGRAEDFHDVALDVEDATGFHRRAWAACRSIPRGETRTYKWLAQMAGSPRASRAAGQTMARNRVPIIVPCHRVVGTDGSLRGFGSGAARLDLKRQLLEMEGAGGRLL